ncbi:AAA family ATPase [Ktedonobacter racemifer]|uniref:Cytidyltransferase-related domain protein n=1 Tax=Ktedonobacter racemifer DSM 44963 TaxID=485913 RepID=D6U740_KTERA|nr:AAA family ATPase [Ktedonobacter racemifer]EFH79701.1 cytidyltransferase-related domain protein [Ktedonobacter racemifer DSM 44963]
MTTGLVLGRFIPPHLGHQYLIDFAQNYVDDLLLVVGTRPTDEIDGELRVAWIKEMAPWARVIRVNDENPEETDPRYWQIWEQTLRAALPYIPDFIFASEDYGWKLAELLGMEYIPVNHPRTLVPISATRLRSNPLQYWQYIPPVVRPHYVKRVCIYGPESTGKSTLTIDLARHFQTVFVEEYARGLLDFKNGRCDDLEDIARIAHGHRASTQALARQANRVLFCDTDLLTTTVWSNALFGTCPSWLYEAADAMSYDLYLVTDIDVPWVDDNQRFFSDQRQEFLDRCLQVLEQRNRPYIRISGSWDARFAKAIRAVEGLLQA